MFHPTFEPANNENEGSLKAKQCDILDFILFI